MSKDKNKLAKELDRASFNTGLNQRSAMRGSSNFKKQEKLRLQGEADTAEADRLQRARLSGGGGMTSMDRYTQSLQKLLRGGGYRKPFDDLTTQLGTMATQAQGTVGSSMDQLSSFLQAQKNPFEGLTAQQTAVQPDLANLLQSQGVSTDPLQQYANTVNTQNAGQATAMQNLMNTLGGIQGANQAGALADVETNRANLQSQLAASQMGMGAQIGQQAMGQQQNLMQMLLEALSRGGRARGGRLF
jgi:hypothetical protein